MIPQFSHQHALNGEPGVGASDKQVLGGVDRCQPLEVVGVLRLYAGDPPDDVMIHDTQEVAWRQQFI